MGRRERARVCACHKGCDRIQIQYTVKQNKTKEKKNTFFLCRDCEIISHVIDQKNVWTTFICRRRDKLSCTCTCTCWTNVLGMLLLHQRCKILLCIGRLLNAATFFFFCVYFFFFIFFSFIWHRTFGNIYYFYQLCVTMNNEYRL